MASLAPPKVSTGSPIITSVKPLSCSIFCQPARGRGHGSGSCARGLTAASVKAGGLGSAGGHLEPGESPYAQAVAALR